MTDHDPLHDELLAKLGPRGQSHLLAFWKQLHPNEHRALAVEIAKIDFDLIERLFHEHASAVDWGALVARAEQPPAFRLGQVGAFSPAEARRRGEAALAAGKFGVVLVAGGQGTRLGFDHPKGMYPIGPVSGASLFQTLLEQIVARARRHGAAIPLCVMTSPATHDETAAYLVEHDHFGLDDHDVSIFCQGTMPAVDARSGQLLLESSSQLALSPDGHGGMLAALDHSGTLHRLRERGVEHLFYLQIDNPLVSICDPEFLGYHLASGSELSTQVIAKESPREKVGNLAMIDGRMHVVEYSDFNHLSDELVSRPDDSGSPIFWAGNVAVHIFSLDFLTRMAGTGAALPFHIAKKAVPFINAKGELVEPTEPNAIKFERFIFDLLPEARRPIVVEVDRAQAFAPLKNGPSDTRDTPATVQAQMSAVARSWLRAAGCRVADGVDVEISPLFALDAEELGKKIPAETLVNEPRYFR